MGQICEIHMTHCIFTLHVYSFINNILNFNKCITKKKGQRMRDNILLEFWKIHIKHFKDNANQCKQYTINLIGDNVVNLG